MKHALEFREGNLDSCRLLDSRFFAAAAFAQNDLKGLTSLFIRSKIATA